MYDRTNGTCQEIEVKTRRIPDGLPVEDGGAVSVDADSIPTDGTGFRMIKRLGRGKGSLMESYGVGSGLTYRFYLTTEGLCTLEVHRFPSLNSTGRIRIGVSVDGGPIQTLESPSTDEWRGSWKANVLDNCDRLTLPVKLTAGGHTVTFHPIDKYFAFSRFVIYTEDRKANNYIGIEGSQELPRQWDAAAWTRKFYGEISLLPRPVEYAQPDREMDSLAVSDLIRQEDHYAPGIEPDWYFQQGLSPFNEKDGCIRFDAAAALAGSESAWMSDSRWQHCSSESYGRTGLAMYVRQRGYRWQPADAPALHYLLHCEGGDYTLWLLAKFGVQEESFFGAGIDGTSLAPETLYNKGCLWRYESEQIYRWVPIAGLALLPGNHELTLYSLASGLRFDRIYLTKGTELPPMDGEWRTT